MGIDDEHEDDCSESMTCCNWGGLLGVVDEDMLMDRGMANCILVDMKCC